MDAADSTRAGVRRQAEDRFAKVIRRDAEVKAYQQKQLDTEAAKVARLRALRLAKEASEPQPQATAKRTPTPKA